MAIKKKSAKKSTKKRPVGRPSEKPKNLCELVDTYIENCQDDFKSDVKSVDLPTIIGLSLELGFNESTLYEWAKTDEEFSKSLEKIKKEQQKRLLNQGLVGNYNSTIAKLILSSNHGMSENQNLNHSGVLTSRVVEVKLPPLNKDG